MTRPGSVAYVVAVAGLAGSLAATPLIAQVRIPRAVPASSGATKLTSRAASVSWGPDRIDVVARGADNAVWHRAYESGQWQGWHSLGGIATSGPAIASIRSGHLDVYVRGTDNGLWHRSYVDGQWLEWESLGGTITSDPAATSWGPGRVDVVAIGTDAALWHIWWDGTWSGWESLGGQLTQLGSSSPTLASWGPGRLDVFAWGRTNEGIWHRWYQGTWSLWEPWVQGGSSPWMSPASESWGSGRVELWYWKTPTDANAVQQLVYDLGKRSQGATLTMPWSGVHPPDKWFINLSSRAAYRLDLFAVSPEGALLMNAFNVSAWSGWQSLGNP